MMEANSTKKSGHFLGQKVSLFGLNKKLKRLFSFIHSKLCPPRTLVINNITIGTHVPKEELDKHFKVFHESLERTLGRGAQ